MNAGETMRRDMIRLERAAIRAQAYSREQGQEIERLRAELAKAKATICGLDFDFVRDQITEALAERVWELPVLSSEIKLIGVSVPLKTVELHAVLALLEAKP